MKRLFSICAMILVFSIIAMGQKDAPKSVTNAFSQKYPAAKSVKWASEEANEWEAEFKLDGKEMTASFDNNGKWLESETEISARELPAAVSSVISKDFAGFKADEMCILDSPDLKGFEVGMKKGETSIEVVFDNDGKILKKTDVSREEKEENEKEGKN